MNATARRCTQAARSVVMIRPASFGPNPQTAESNRFQSRAAAGPAVAAAARREFDALAAALDDNGVDVHRFEGRGDGALPDEVFPNNWLSFHDDGTVVLYPMQAANRRAERRRDVLEHLRECGFRLRRVLDLTHFERDGRYLEGTGSLVLDRAGRIAYACRSARTDDAVLDEWAKALAYTVHRFDAADRDAHPVYHTNVLLSIGTDFALLCSAAIADAGERRALTDRLAASGREIIELSLTQMHAFAGNALELAGRDGAVIALSERALASLDDRQQRRLRAHGRLVSAAIDDIETYGGGSVRCMLAEVHLPQHWIPPAVSRA